MKWLKAWLRKWLGVESDRIDWQTNRINEITQLRERVENLREHYASVKEMGESCMARLDRETIKLATAINSQADKHAELVGDQTETSVRVTAGLKTVLDHISLIRAESIESVKLADADQKRISELEAIVKDATLDTALAELEDRVAKLESTPVPTSGPQGRRGGASWNSHQVAAGQGAALANGSPVPIPTPGVS